MGVEQRVSGVLLRYFLVKRYFVKIFFSKKVLVLNLIGKNLNMLKNGFDPN